MGIVTRVEKTRIEVEGTDGTPIAITVTPSTVYKKGKNPATLSDVIRALSRSKR